MLSQNHINRLSQAPNPFTGYGESYKKSTAYWHKSIKLLEAFNSLSQKPIASASPIIAVMDSGVDIQSSELAVASE